MNKVDEALSGNQQVVQSNAREYEDEFKGIYGLSIIQGPNSKDVSVIEPPYNPLTLEKLVKHNNALGPCIDAMVNNIDGTGHEIVPIEGIEVEAVQADIDILKDFFDEPWPGMSFTSIRKKLRNDMETEGYAALEVVRNAKKEVLFVRHIEAKTIRLLSLDEAQETTKIVKRAGKYVETKIKLRFRRFVQKIGASNVFFKEFGCPVGMSKTSGQWMDGAGDAPFGDRASEIIYFTVEKDVNTPYGVPRWINQSPSVLGSRAAEEYNLSFFESGGVPPFMIIVSGGNLAPQAKTAIERGITSKDSKHKGFVIEAMATAGSIADAGKVSVSVERFGAEKQNDSMFENYDVKAEARVRKAFRLPPLFVGLATDYSYATAFASYVVAEAQVFKPERDEFDEVVNLLLIPEILKKKDCQVKFRSLPITVTDIEHKLRALELASTKNAIGRQEILDNLNEITGMDMQVVDDDEYEKIGGNQQNNFIDPSQGRFGGGFNKKPAPEEKKPLNEKKSEVDAILVLAEDFVDCILKNDFGLEYKKNMEMLGTLNRNQLGLFKSYLANSLYANMSPDEFSGDIAVASLVAIGRRNPDDVDA